MASEEPTINLRPINKESYNLLRSKYDVLPRPTKDTPKEDAKKMNDKVERYRRLLPKTYERNIKEELNSFLKKEELSEKSNSESKNKDSIATEVAKSPASTKSEVDTSKNTPIKNIEISDPLTETIKSMARRCKKLMGEFTKSTEVDDKRILLHQLSKHLIILVTLINQKDTQPTIAIEPNIPGVGNLKPLIDSIEDMTRRCKELMSEINDTTEDENKRILLRILSKHLIILATLINQK